MSDLKENPLTIELVDDYINYEQFLTDVLNDHLDSVQNFHITAMNEHRLRVTFEVRT